jgi:hypothetical protein
LLGLLVELVLAIFLNLDSQDLDVKDALLLISLFDHCYATIIYIQWVIIADLNYYGHIIIFCLSS